MSKYPIVFVPLEGQATVISFDDFDGYITFDKCDLEGIPQIVFHNDRFYFLNRICILPDSRKRSVCYRLSSFTIGDVIELKPKIVLVV